MGSKLPADLIGPASCAVGGPAIMRRNPALGRELRRQASLSEASVAIRKESPSRHQPFAKSLFGQIYWW